MRHQTLLQRNSRRQLRNRLQYQTVALTALVALLLPAARGLQAQPRFAAAPVNLQAAPLADAQVNQRANALLAQMTLDERSASLRNSSMG